MKIYIVQTNWNNNTKETIRAFHGQKEMLSAVEEKVQNECVEGTIVKAKISSQINFFDLTINSIDIEVKLPNLSPFTKTINYNVVELE